jgi:hypothetical protein
LVGWNPCGLTGDPSDGCLPLSVMPSRYAFNSWPNRSTWLVARWLSSSKYGYMATIAEHQWQKYRGISGRSRLARNGMAEKISKDIAANSTTIGLGEPEEAVELLAEVTWEEIADHWLKRLPGYKSIGPAE